MNKNQLTEKISRPYCFCIPKGSDVDEDWKVVLDPIFRSFSHVSYGHGNESSQVKFITNPCLSLPFPLNFFVHIFLSSFCCLIICGMRQGSAHGAHLL